MNQGKKLYRHMGDEKIRMRNNHKKKNKNIINRNNGGNGGGNDIAGLVLAVVGFIAVVTFSIVKHRTKPKPKPQNSFDKRCNKSIEDHEIETNQGLLHALLQPSTSTTTTKDEDVVAPCQAITDAKNINHTFIQEEIIESVSDIKSEVVFETSIHHDEIVLSDDFNSESAVSEAEKMDENDDEAVSEIVEEKDCSLNAILNTEEKQDFNSKGGKIDVQNEEHVEEKANAEEGLKIDVQNEEHVEEKAVTEEGGKIDVQNEEHVAEKKDIEVTDDEDVKVESEITYEDEGNLSMEVNDEDKAILVSNSNQFSTLLMLLPGLLLLLVLLLLMHLTKNIFSALVL